ncbi:hypothetical protein CPB83DRAFT_673783 [Crepidotus variabilis]|uniref:Mid2 domain-containing protein n=1 Tax=Crepidotus variabilis TaxID=179855 RepID=A0A9P6JU05_9AGAR|nr:hypothetical protein CPB83DRAFT_673783 [Crepidotus variabilis]
MALKLAENLYKWITSLARPKSGPTQNRHPFISHRSPENYLANSSLTSTSKSHSSTSASLPTSISSASQPVSPTKPTTGDEHAALSNDISSSSLTATVSASTTSQSNTSDSNQSQGTLPNSSPTGPITKLYTTSLSNPSGDPAGPQPSSRNEGIHSPTKHRHSRIIGPIVGSVLSLFFIILVIVFIIRRRHRRNLQVAPSAEFLGRDGGLTSERLFTPSPTPTYGNEKGLDSFPQHIFMGEAI